MEKSQGTGIESVFRIMPSIFASFRCMEKSQGTGIERATDPNVQWSSYPSMHGKIPRNGNWKPETEPAVKVKEVPDAWKNPKERELKVDGLLGGKGFDIPGCMEKSQGTGIERQNQRRRQTGPSAEMHGKIPRNGNWKAMFEPVNVALLQLRCMEKSQGTGIESLDFAAMVLGLLSMGCMEKSQGTGIERPNAWG